jgi:hypothetical protein
MLAKRAGTLGVTLQLEALALARGAAQARLDLLQQALSANA